MAGNRLKNVEQVNDSPFGVCIWELPDGSVFGDGEGRILSLQGAMFDPVIEVKMTKAVKSYAGGDIGGKTVWINGARKISDSEHDDQMERLLDGSIPDPADQAAQLEG